MDRESARQTIRSSWRQILQGMEGAARQRVNGEQSYICPICGNGEGSSGDGITKNPKSRDGNGLKCFKCGFSGDIIDLYQQHTGADYNTALQLLAQEVGITIDAYRPTAADDFKDAQKQAAQEATERPQEAETQQGRTNTPATGPRPQEGAQEATGKPADYTAYYKQCRERINDPDALAYLSLRGISPETAAAYWLGYDPEWSSPTARSRGKNPPASPRLIIPTSTGHYIARDTRQQLTDRQKAFAKMNEGSPAIFNERALYAQDAQEVFITEGAIDALSIIEAGSPAIAINSTSNAAALLQKLERKRTAATLILCLDNDDAGKRAADELRAGLQRLNISHIKADICGSHKDPNEALTTDRAAFVEAIEAAIRQAGKKPDNVSYYIENLMGAEIARFKKDIKTGFANLDEQAGGLYSGLYVLAAISSLGKTTFAHQMADQIAEAGNDVLFFSMEQSRLEMVSKSIARRTAQKNPQKAVTSLAIRKGYLPDIVQQAAQEYKDIISDRLSIIEGNFNCNISFIGDYIRQYMRRNEAAATGEKPVVIIDYLQILQPQEDEQGRRQTVKEAVDSTVTELKRISRELDITIIVVCSVNRANYLTPIDFESLKESGGIEYTADVVWGLQLQCLNDSIFDKATNIKEKRQRVREAKAATPRKIELVCLKNRYGISSYSCYYNYFPASDLFTECSTAELDFRQATQPKAGGKM